MVHELKLRFMGRAAFWRCACRFETADLSKVAQHAVSNQFTAEEVSRASGSRLVAARAGRR